MPAFTLTVDGGVGRLGLDLPDEPVNKITSEVREELEQFIDRITVDAGIQAVVLISDKADNFIAGADIDEFVRLTTKEEAFALVRAGQTLINRLAELGKPVVAAIHGACLGGGLEAALACAYRVATDHPKTQIGLPEIKLGIIPAAGGCQRLPRLIGLPAALDIILAGKQVPARRAQKLGLVDELVHPAILERVARDAALRLVSNGRTERKHVDLKRLLLDKNPLGRRFVLSKARKEVLRTTGGNYPAPLAALDTIERGLAEGLQAGLQADARAFADLAVGGVSRHLVQIFFATTALKKDPGVSGDAPPSRSVDRVGIVGAGFMGASIGGVAVSQAGVDVRLRDQDLPSVGRGLANARRVLEKRRDRKRISKVEFQRLERLLSGTTDWSGFRRANLVIEAVFEDLAVKQEVFRQLDAQVPGDCVLASNTSTIPIANIAAVTRHPERVLGMHFFSPVDRMPLLEVIVTDQTAPWVTVTAVMFGRRMNKTVIVVRDHPGFWVNRILAPYLNEAGRLLQEGVAIETIDREMTKFGFPVGPITLLDEVGLDVAHKASNVMHDAFGERMTPTSGIGRMIDDGRLGRKNGRGFFRYENGKKRGVDEAVYEIIGAQPSSNLGRDDVHRRLVYAMLNEAAHAVAEQVVRSPRDGDIGAVFGIGFPPFRGGPLRYLDDLGAAAAVETLRTLADRHGDRFHPAPALEDMASRSERFYPDD